MTERLSPLDAATVELLGTVAHQLRTPLTAVSGYVELLAEHCAGPLTGDQERILGTIARNTDRLIGMINSFDVDAADAAAATATVSPDAAASPTPIGGTARPSRRP